jgi:hypothetical protein
VHGFEEHGMIYASRVGMTRAGDWMVILELAKQVGDTDVDVGSIFFTLKNQLESLPQIERSEYIHDSKNLPAFFDFLILDERKEWDSAIGRFFVSGKFPEFFFTLPNELRKTLENNGVFKNLKIESTDDQKSWDLNLQLEIINPDEKVSAIEWHAKLFSVSSNLPEVFAINVTPVLYAVSCQDLFIKR